MVMNRLPRFLAILLIPAIFCSGKLPEFADGWAWLREDPASWRSHDDVLELRAQKGRIWGGGGAKNLLVERLPAGGRTVTVDVSHGAPENIYEQGGLLLMRDDDHFVKLIVEFIEGEYFIVMAREIGGKGKVFTKLGFADKAARLRLAVSGDEVSASFATRGSERFEPAGECELPGASAAHFALFTQDGSDEELRWIRFENLQVTPAATGGGCFDTRQLS